MTVIQKLMSGLVMTLICAGIKCGAQRGPGRSNHLSKLFLHSFKPTTTEAPLSGAMMSNVLPSPAAPISALFVDGKRDVDMSDKDEKERQLDTLGGIYAFDYRPPRSVDEYEEAPEYYSADEDETDQQKRGFDTLGHMQLHGYKRGFDTLGNMQLHGYKRGLDTLGNMQLHSYYKRGFDTLGNMQLHSYYKRRPFDTLGGSRLHSGYKRFLSSLGGTNIHSYKRSIDDQPEDKRFLSTLGGNYIHSGFNRLADKRRYLSTLGGTNIYNYKRGLDSLGGANLHGAFKRYLSSLGGTHIHDYGMKRTLPSFGEVNKHGGFNMAGDVEANPEIYPFEVEDKDGNLNDETNEGDDVLDKRSLDTLGGFGLHRYRRSDAKVQNKNAAIKFENMHDT
ncbi:feeding circuit activating peptides-like [Dreissena polymorpha]|uniref:Uncharacterized protein n=1 Tax=Dreissena polymorpha TaxID=45954 RepID=A0A9D4HZQ5_DREPO|nr:feeding circuit activating peptides-like [Dreissena polymorpha]KAH3741310.1 hypothetical protein DPMN_048033 [Dreissena polymorpha]